MAGKIEIPSRPRTEDFLAEVAKGEPFEILRESLNAYVVRSLDTGVGSPSEALHILVDLYNDRYPQAKIGMATFYSWWSGRRTKPDLTFGIRSLDLLRSV